MKKIGLAKKSGFIYIGSDREWFPNHPTMPGLAHLLDSLGNQFFRVSVPAPFKVPPMIPKNNKYKILFGQYWTQHTAWIAEIGNTFGEKDRKFNLQKLMIMTAIDNIIRLGKSSSFFASNKLIGELLDIGIRQSKQLIQELKEDGMIVADYQGPDGKRRYLSVSSEWYDKLHKKKKRK